MRRLAAVLVAAGFLVVAVAASLSDRAPSVLGAAARRVGLAGQGFEQRFHVDVVSRDDVPWSVTELAHLVGWGSGMVLIGLTARRRWSPLVIAGALLVTSVAIEVGQARFSSLRTFELDDIALNAVGIGAGLAVVVVVGRLLDRAERHRWGT